MIKIIALKRIKVCQWDYRFFFRQIKVSIKYYQLSVDIKYSVRNLFCDASNYAWPAN